LRTVDLFSWLALRFHWLTSFFGLVLCYLVFVRTCFLLLKAISLIVTHAFDFAACDECALTSQGRPRWRRRPLSVHAPSNANNTVVSCSKLCLICLSVSLSRTVVPGVSYDLSNRSSSCCWPVLDVPLYSCWRSQAIKRIVLLTSLCWKLCETLLRRPNNILSYRIRDRYTLHISFATSRLVPRVTEDKLLSSGMAASKLSFL